MGSQPEDDVGLGQGCHCQQAQQREAKGLAITKNSACHRCVFLFPVYPSEKATQQQELL